MRRKWITAIAAIALGVVLHVWTGVWMQSNGPSDNEVSAILGFLYPALLPYVASSVVLWVTRVPSIAFWSTIFSLGLDVIFLFAVVLFPSDPFGGLVWYFAHWWNLFVLFPFGLLIGWRLDSVRRSA